MSGGHNNETHHRAKERKVQKKLLTPTKQPDILKPRGKAKGLAANRKEVYYG